MNKLLIVSCILLLTACASTKRNIEVELQKPSAEIMKDCSNEKARFKDGMTTLDIAQMVLDERNLKNECSILNDKKKAFIESLYKTK